MLDLLLFFWPVSALVNATPEPSPRPTRRRAPSRRVAENPRAPRGKAKRPRSRPALRVLEGGRAGMP